MKGGRECIGTQSSLGTPLSIILFIVVHSILLKNTRFGGHIIKIPKKPNSLKISLRKIVKRNREVFDVFQKETHSKHNGMVEILFLGPPRNKFQLA